jgi:Lrp/AsnC family transcriptional regulator, leucine-responsive regulatory protein
VRRLEERGLIQGYRAVLDPQALGYHVQAVVLINLAGHQAGPIDAFESQVRALPEVKLCLNVTGRYDYLLHVVVRDIEHLRQLVTGTWPPSAACRSRRPSSCWRPPSRTRATP